MTVVVRQPTEYKGCVIDHLCEVEAKSVTTTINEDEKVELEGGRLAVDSLCNSYAYGDEIQLVYYTRQKPRVRQRVDGHRGWFRVEVHLSKNEAAKLVRGIMK